MFGTSTVNGSVICPKHHIILNQHPRPVVILVVIRRVMIGNNINAEDMVMDHNTGRTIVKKVVTGTTAKDVEGHLVPKHTVRVTTITNILLTTIHDNEDIVTLILVETTMIHRIVHVVIIHNDDMIPGIPIVINMNEEEIETRLPQKRTIIETPSVITTRKGTTERNGQQQNVTKVRRMTQGSNNTMESIVIPIKTETTNETNTVNINGMTFPMTVVRHMVHIDDERRKAIEEDTTAVVTKKVQMILLDAKRNDTKNGTIDRKERKTVSAKGESMIGIHDIKVMRKRITIVGEKIKEVGVVHIANIENMKMEMQRTTTIGVEWTVTLKNNNN
jgi:hypothetical protein